MKIFLVGGAVRDSVMGIDPKDRDYVVVGASPSDLTSAGFKQVGADFPVFLHPHTGHEYALARTERKAGLGYNGFETRHDPGVSLEEDLARRDLTINSMAIGEDGTLIDPFDGAGDIRRKILRHTTDAFREDPVRVLRVARFMARWPDFSVADDTMTLMRWMVEDGLLKELTRERILKELVGAMGESNPVRFFQTLIKTGGLYDVFPFLKDTYFLQVLSAIDVGVSYRMKPSALMSVFLGGGAVHPMDIFINHLPVSGDTYKEALLTRMIHESLHLIPFRGPEFVAKLVHEIHLTSRGSAVIERAMQGALALAGMTLEAQNGIRLLRASVAAYQDVKFDESWLVMDPRDRGAMHLQARCEAIRDIVSRNRLPITALK